MSSPSLFTPLKIGHLECPNRIVMAPLTRMRAGGRHVPTALNVEYYAQRASAGLIITEGTAISPEAHGYPQAPGIYTPEQIAGWQQVTEAVHFRGGRIIMQLQHSGRNSHSSFMPDGGPPFAPSAVPSNLPGFTADFRQVPIETPRALTTEQVKTIIEDFHRASVNAQEAGFDGVEIQAANSHLIDQFLENGTNLRTDEYGGSLEGRLRFLLEVVDHMCAGIPKLTVGVRLSPFGQYGGIYDSQPLELFTSVIEDLSRRGITYLHLVEGRASEIGLDEHLNENASNNAQLFRPKFDGPLITAGAFTPQTAATTVEDRHADAVAFGRMFIANSDLVARIRRGLPLNAYDRSTFYGGGEHGYTDYPVFDSFAQKIAIAV